MNYNRIKEFAATKNLTIAALCQKIGMSETGFHQAVKNDSLKIRALEDIASVLEVNPAIFFDGSGSHNNTQNTTNTVGNVSQKMHVGKFTNVKDCEKELEGALQRIADLEARIVDKDDLIAVLKERK